MGCTTIVVHHNKKVVHHNCGALQSAVVHRATASLGGCLLVVTVRVEVMQALGVSRGHPGCRGLGSARDVLTQAVLHFHRLSQEQALERCVAIQGGGRYIHGRRTDGQFGWNETSRLVRSVC